MISRSAILTAGYCLAGVLSTDLFIGAHTIEDATEQYQLKMSTPDITIIIHPGYVAGASENDIAIVKIPTPIGFFNHAVNLVYLPKNPSETFEGLPGIILGFGQTGFAGAVTNRVFMGNTQVIDNAVCAPSFTTVIPDQICTDNTDSGVCVGDEGGPLVIVRNGRYVQVGIIQVLYTGGLFQDCRSGNKVYTRITSHLPWIDANM